MALFTQDFAAKDHPNVDLCNPNVCFKRSKSVRFISIASFLYQIKSLGFHGIRPESMKEYLVGHGPTWWVTPSKNFTDLKQKFLSLIGLIDYPKRNTITVKVLILNTLMVILKKKKVTLLFFFFLLSYLVYFYYINIIASTRFVMSYWRLCLILSAILAGVSAQEGKFFVDSSPSRKNVSDSSLFVLFP